VRNAATAVTIDVGNPDNVHAVDKQIVAARHDLWRADRLSLAAVRPYLHVRQSSPHLVR
jgi:hypothetical protein